MTKPQKKSAVQHETADANPTANTNANATGTVNACASGTTLRLILGDQLNPQHSWFTPSRKGVDSGVVYVLMEVRQETDYVLHHAQKILAIFAGMRDFARQLTEAGHRVHYVKIDDPANQTSMTANLDRLIQHYGAAVFEYQDPDEWRLDAQLADYASRLKIACQKVSSEHFYTERNDPQRCLPAAPSG